MPNPTKKVDCSVLQDTYLLMNASCPLDFAKEIVGGKFMSPEFQEILSNGIEKTTMAFDDDGKYGEFITYPGTQSVKMEHKVLANTDKQKKLLKDHTEIIARELDELASSPALNEYPAIKGYIEYRNRFVKGARDGSDRFAILADIPGGYGLRGSPDWTTVKHGEPKNAKQFEDMLVGMQYDKLFALTDEYIDLELQMRHKALTPEQQEEFKEKRIDQNNRMIKIYENQKSPECREKYWEYFQKYDDTIAGARGVGPVIGKLKEQNQALENGWDVSRLYMFHTIKDISDICKKAQAGFDHFNKPELRNAQAISKKLANLDPTDRKFESMEEFDKYMTEFSLAYTSLVNEAEKPEVHESLHSIYDTLSTSNGAYCRANNDRAAYIKEHKNDPDFVAPPETPKPVTFGMPMGLFHSFGSELNGSTFRLHRENAKNIDPAYYDIEGDPALVEKRKAEIEKARTPVVAEKGFEYTRGKTLSNMDGFNIKKADEINKAQDYIDTTYKASKLASEKLRTLPALPEELKANKTYNKLYKEYVSSLKTVANIQDRTRIINKNTTGDIEGLATDAKRLEMAFEKNKNAFPEAFRKSIEDSAKEFTDIYFEAKEKGESFDSSQDMNAYINTRKHQIACVETAMNASFSKEKVFDAKEHNSVNKAITDLTEDIRLSNEANKVFIRHSDFDDAVKAMDKLAVELKKYKTFIANRSESGNSEREILENTGKQAEALQKAAQEASKKLEAYLARKGKEKNLNEKGEKRVETFKKALETTKGIGVISGERIIETDARLAAMDNAEMLKGDIKAADEKINAYNKAAENESLSDIEKMAAQFAAVSAESLKELVTKNGELTEQDMAVAKDAIVLSPFTRRSSSTPRATPPLRSSASRSPFFPRIPPSSMQLTSAPPASEILSPVKTSPRKPLRFTASSSRPRTPKESLRSTERTPTSRWRSRWRSRRSAISNSTPPQRTASDNTLQSPSCCAAARYGGRFPYGASALTGLLHEPNIR